MASDLLDAVLTALRSPAIVISRDERISHANAAATRLLGAGIPGRHPAVALRSPAILDAITACQMDGQASETRFVLPSGSRDLVFVATVSRIDGAGFNGVLCLLMDVTETEQARESRRDFVANVSHELKTPLTALIGFIETLRGPARNDAVATERFLAIMDREAGRMNRLVSDLLNLSRVEALERVRPSEPVDLVALLSVVLSTLRPMADAASVTFDLAGHPAQGVVPGDADQLTQVFHNLIENAVKYGGAGKSVVVEFADAALPSGPAIQVSVTDQGDGIEAMHLPRLTERFYRIDSHRSREQGGTGLGLAIVKHIVQRHRGRLVIDSMPGQGSTFSVLLPLA